MGVGASRVLAEEPEGRGRTPGDARKCNQPLNEEGQEEEEEEEEGEEGGERRKEHHRSPWRTGLARAGEGGREGRTAIRHS